MSVLLENLYIPESYDLSLEISDLKPNYTGKVLINLIKNERYNKESIDTKDFCIFLNTAEIVSLSSSIILDNDSSKSFKLSHSLNKSNETTKYYSNDLKFSDLIQSSSITLEIKFLAVIRKILTYSDVTKGVFQTKYMDPVSGKSDKFLLSTHSQPFFSHYIFPCLDDINLKSKISLSLIVKNEFTCISNLPIESSNFVPNSNNKLVKFIQSPPMNLSLFSFAIGDFDYIENKVNLPISKNDLPIRIYTMVGDSNKASFALNIVSTVVPELEKKFNVNYPLPKLDIIALPFLSDGGVENWSMIQIINDHLLLPDYKISNNDLINLKNRITDVLTHELIHMYIGNLITFDSYDHTWLNESFATFMSNTLINQLFDNKKWFKILNTDLQSFKFSNSNENSKPILIQNVNIDKIHNTFTKNSYEKGIFIIRMLASLFVNDLTQLDNNNFDIFFKIIGEFIELQKFNNFKPIDLWNFLKSNNLNKFNYDIPTIMNSWIRIPGFPILSINKNSSNNSFELKQNRYLDYPVDDIEDIPFQIPLLIKNDDKSLGRQMIIDRSLKINYNDNSKFSLFNANNSCILNINYSRDIIIDLINNFSNLNNIEQLEIFKNYSQILGTSYQSNDSILSFFEIFKLLKKINKLDNYSISFGLSILSNLYTSIKTFTYFKDEKLFNSLNKFIDELINKFILQFDWDIKNWESIDKDELNLRNSILSLKLDNESVQNIGKKYFKKILHGPKNSLPIEFLTTIFQIISQSATIKEYKEISKLVRNPGLINVNIIDANPVDIQTAAINCLGFMKDNELIHKTLNYARTNTDIKLIELSLLGLRFQMNYYETFWNWYKLNYKPWLTKYLRDKKSYQGLFFKHVSELIFKCCLYDPKLNQIIEDFIKSLNIDDVNEWFAEIKFDYENILTLNNANNELKTILN